MKTSSQNYLTKIRKPRTKSVLQPKTTVPTANTTRNHPEQTITPELVPHHPLHRITHHISSVLFVLSVLFVHYLCHVHTNCHTRNKTMYQTDQTVEIVSINIQSYRAPLEDPPPTGEVVTSPKLIIMNKKTVTKDDFSCE